MDIEEAKIRYGIKVPTANEFYSEEYKEFFKNGKNDESAIEKYGHYSEFEEMYQKSAYITFRKIIDNDSNTQKLSLRDSKAVVLGGQAGAGKSSLVGVALREAEEKQRGLCLIDDDDYRALYPKHDEIRNKCPEHYTAITAIGTANVTPKIMKYASDNGINFIFDGTMKSTRILDTAMEWQGYEINWKIMATSRLESLLSVFERGNQLKKQGLCRSLTVDIHDETYLGLESTLTQLESLNNMGRIQVYRRGKDIKNPLLIYDSYKKENVYNTAVAALRGGRQEDRIRCIKQGVEARIKKLKERYFELNLAERKALDDLEESIKIEMSR